MSRYQESWDRIKRAHPHGNTFVAAANELFHLNPPHLTLEFHHDGKSSGIGFAKVSFDKPHERELPLVLGEFFYQLRAALDGAFWAAAIHVL